MRLAVFLFFSSIAFAQQSASTSAPCSPIAPNNKGSITINCPGMSKEQGRKMIAILNKILANQLDPDAVMKLLESTSKNVEEIREQGQLSGFLTPSDEPTPPNPCDGNSPDGSMVLLLGNSASVETKPVSTIIRIGDDRMLIMEKIEGRIAISARLFSQDGRIVAELKRNQFFINPSNYFRKEISSDGHSLAVYDQNDFEVLNVRFLNPTTISFLGLIRHPSRNVEISSTRGFFANRACSTSSEDSEFVFLVPAATH